VEPIPQGRSRSVRVLGALVLLLVLLAVVALASHSGFGHTAQPTATPGYVNWAMSVFLVFFVLMIPVAIYSYSIQMTEFRVQNKRRRSMQARILRGFGVIAVILLILAVRGFLHRHHALPKLNAAWLTGGSDAARHGNRGNHYEPTFQWPVLWVTVALFAVAGGWYLWKRAHREVLPAWAPAGSVADDVADSIDDAIDDLEAEPDARRAVIAAYARMERAFGRHGLTRLASETPTEYLRRILLGLTTKVDAVKRLTGLFEQARFSDHAIDGAMKQDAIDSLRTIRDDLQAAPS
jgi:uncharacterized protein DUF4129